MKRILSLVIAVLIIFTVGGVSTIAANAGGTTYYIDSVKGSDKNSGKSSAKAWKTLEKASTIRYKKGDTILLKRGCKFNGTFTGAGYGTKNLPITVSAYGKGKNPVLTQSKDEYIMFFSDIKYWTIKNLSFRDSNRAIRIFAMNDVDVTGVRITACDFDNIGNNPGKEFDGEPCIFADNGDSKALLRNMVISNLKITNCGRGMEIKGKNRERGMDSFVNEKVSYSPNILIENIYCKNLQYDAIILGSMRDSRVRNCRLLDTCYKNDFATAPIWLHHCDNVTVEYCEISNANGQLDGMAIDFDGWTINSTYQYIYSHGNKRFMRNCLFDRETRNRNNTVRYCLSVNDNEGVFDYPSFVIPNETSNFITSMEGFNFYNNTIINGNPYLWINIKSANVKNNIFASDSALRAGGKAMLNGFSIGVSKSGNVNTTVKNAGFVGGDTYNIRSWMLRDSSKYLGKGCFTDASTANMLKIPVK
ncbi:MAG: hypothetical protein IK097_07955 [Clostridia bacterium]|nr:hypothetical protein [Clostridia bacterium]